MIKQYSQDDNISYKYYQSGQYQMRMSNNISSIIVSGSRDNNIKRQISDIKNINPNLTILEPYCFNECYNLKNVDIQKSNIKEIGEYAFRECINLQTFKTKLNHDIKTNAFIGCINLSIITQDGFEKD